MPMARIVVAQGAIDGANVVFGTGTPYVAGSTAYILNGRIHNQALARGAANDYGFVELSPDAGLIQVDNPPLPGDVVQIFFWDRVVVPAPPVGALVGTIGPASVSSATGGAAQLSGTIQEGTPAPTQLVGVLK